MQTKTPTPGPMKLPKLKVDHEQLEGASVPLVLIVDTWGCSLSDSQAAECIRRVELHDELVEALREILDSHLAQRFEADGADLNGMGAAIGKSYLGIRLRQARAVLNKSQGA